MSDGIVVIPLTDPESRTAFGNVGSVVYRDNVNGVRFTAHYDPMNDAGWIVQHEGHKSDSDGLPVARSALLYGYGALNSAWDAVRNTANKP